MTGPGCARPVAGQRVQIDPVLVPGWFRYRSILFSATRHEVSREGGRLANAQPCGGASPIESGVNARCACPCSPNGPVAQPIRTCKGRGCSTRPTA